MCEEFTLDTVFSRSGGLLRGMRSLLCVCSTRLPGCPDGSAPALRGESGPTIRVRCAAGRHGDRHGGRHGTHLRDRHDSRAAPAASPARDCWAVRLTHNANRAHTEAIYRVYLFIVSMGCRVVCVRTVFFRVVCQWFTPDTVFYAFGRSSFGLCVNGLHQIPHFMCSDGVLSGCV